jgi:hypothetical protein
MHIIFKIKKKEGKRQISNLVSRMCHCITKIGILEKLKEEKAMRKPEIYNSLMQLSRRRKKRQIVSIYKAKKTEKGN